MLKLKNNENKDLEKDRRIKSNSHVSSLMGSFEKSYLQVPSENYSIGWTGEDIRVIHF